MSSNAFARSRPRVRHQRVPRTVTCEHPRFLKLVNELARLNDLKNKKESQVEDRSHHQSAQNTHSSTPSTVHNNKLNNSARNHPTTISSNSLSTLNHQHHHIKNYYDCSAQSASRTQDDGSGCSNCADFKNNISSNCADSHRAATNTNPIANYAKHIPLVQQAESNNFFTTNFNHNQDENRSKRKRHDSLPTPYSQISTRKGSNCANPTIKKFKTSESPNLRPLSPSFTKCPICLLDCLDRDPSFTNTCFHLFCYVCIENWTKNKATCPLCRTEFTKIIYNIKSATTYEEKIARPTRRDDDDVIIPERFMLNGFRLSNPPDFSPPTEFLLRPNLFNLDRRSIREHPNLNNPENNHQVLHINNASRYYHHHHHHHHLPNYIIFSPNQQVQQTSSMIPSATTNEEINPNIHYRRSNRHSRYPSRDFDLGQVDSTHTFQPTNTINVDNLTHEFDIHLQQHFFHQHMRTQIPINMQNQRIPQQQHQQQSNQTHQQHQYSQPRAFQEESRPAVDSIPPYSEHYRAGDSSEVLLRPSNPRRVELDAFLNNFFPFN